MNQILSMGGDPQKKKEKNDKQAVKQNINFQDVPTIPMDNNFEVPPTMPMDSNFNEAPTIPMDSSFNEAPTMPMDSSFDKVPVENNFSVESVVPMDNSFEIEQMPPTVPMDSSYEKEQIVPMNNNFEVPPVMPMEDNFNIEPIAPIDSNFEMTPAPSFTRYENELKDNEPRGPKRYEIETNYAGETTAKADIKQVIKVFCIVIIIFGMVLIGKSTYSIVKNKTTQKDNPIVDIEKMGREATITINTEKPIREYSYRWNEGEATTEKGNGSISVEKSVQIPNGNNILRIEVVDYYGNRTKYFKQYIYESTDVNKPTIDIAAVGIKLKITAKDDNEMYYMTYSWNDEEAVRVDLLSDDKKTIETEIEVRKGQNKLTITAVDKEENREIRTESVVGDTKPTFELSTDGENIIVVANDDEGVAKISITIDDQTTDSGDTPINQTDVTARMPITSGEHTITVTVTNINGLTETQTITHTF